MDFNLPKFFYCTVTKTHGGKKSVLIKNLAQIAKYTADHGVTPIIIYIFLINEIKRHLKG